MLKNGTKSVWEEICQNFHVGRNLFKTKSVTPEINKGVQLTEVSKNMFNQQKIN